MSYEKTNWVDRTPTNSGTPVNADNMNKIEEGIEDVAGAIIAFRDEFSRGATIKIAASNATEKSKAAADYVCTGGNDEEIINAAIQELDGTGGCVELSEGNFVTAGDGIVGTLDSIWLKGQGCGTVVECTTEGIGVDTTTGIARISDMSITNPNKDGIVVYLGVVYISGCKIFGCGGFPINGAIRVQGIATITNCEIVDNNHYGVSCRDASKNCIITNNRFINNAGGNFNDAGTNNVFENNAEVV